MSIIMNKSENIKIIKESLLSQTSKMSNILCKKQLCAAYVYSTQSSKLSFRKSDIYGTFESLLVVSFPQRESQVYAPLRFFLYGTFLMDENMYLMPYLLKQHIQTLFNLVVQSRHGRWWQTIYRSAMFSYLYKTPTPTPLVNCNENIEQNIICYQIYDTVIGLNKILGLLLVRSRFGAPVRQQYFNFLPATCFIKGHTQTLQKVESSLMIMYSIS